MNNTPQSSIEKIQQDVERETLMINPDTPVEHFPDPAARATPHKLKSGEDLETLDIPSNIPSSRPNAPSIDGK